MTLELGQSKTLSFFVSNSARMVLGYPLLVIKKTTNAKSKVWIIPLIPCQIDMVKDIIL